MKQLEKTGRLLEILVIFVGLPLLFYLGMIPLPKIAALLLVAAYCLVRLWRDDNFTTKVQDIDYKSKKYWRVIIIRSVIVASLLMTLIWWVQPQQFLSFPKERPVVWMVLMLLYPILSALPQELIYRTYFFHVLQEFFSSNRMKVFASALAFSILHIVYDNWWAVGLSFPAGIMFSVTYLRTESLFWVTVEHAIYGCLLFTLGFGNYFY